MKFKLPILLLFNALIACKSAMAGDITAYLKVASYCTVSGQCYLETYIDIHGSTVLFKKDTTGKWHGEVNIRVWFRKSDTNFAENDYNLFSPEMPDSGKRCDLIDVQRYVLPKGEYTFRIMMLDKNNPAGRTITQTQMVKVGYDMDSISISDAEFLQSFSPSQETGPTCKNGYRMVPYINDYYPDIMSQINFYAEVYGTSNELGAGRKYILKYFLESYETHSKVNDYNNVSVKTADTVTPLLGGFSISSLPSGKYLLVIDVLDDKNKLRATRAFGFIRHNSSSDINMHTLAEVITSNTFVEKITNRDSLYWYIKFLKPISRDEEKNFELNLDTSKISFALQKQFFYNFWSSRDQNNPEQAWRNYYSQVQDVNKAFNAMNTKGFETDRGRVYLQYGAPNQRVKYDMNPNSYPYEIWEYYQLNDGETDRKFVFYDPDLVTNNYLLLYSNARGEIQNRRWQQMLQSRSEYGRSSEGDIDNNYTPDPFGEFTEDQFNNPH